MPSPSYPADPGGRFSSDVHRRVLGHLTTPDENKAWTLVALYTRMLPDIGTDFQSLDELRGVLNDLIADLYVRQVDTPRGPGFQMTDKGFELLTGPALELGKTEKGPVEIVGVSAIGSSDATLEGGEHEGSSSEPGAAE